MSGVGYTSPAAAPEPTDLQLQIEQFYKDKVSERQADISKSVQDVLSVVQSVLKEVESQEPRFVASPPVHPSAAAPGLGADTPPTRPRQPGLEVISPHEFHMVLYLNQIGVFNFVDENTAPGTALLRLIDGRKRSMSLWVEFITASGYLSAKKIRCRFQALIAQAVEKQSYSSPVKMLGGTSEVRLKIGDSYVVQITPAFRCPGFWPQSASNWPESRHFLPNPSMETEVKATGFSLLSEDCAQTNKDKNGSTSSEGDCWTISFIEAEDKLLLGMNRKKVLSIFKCLADRHLRVAGQPVKSYHLKTLLLYECEKHPLDQEWATPCLGDRINSILLQLISGLQNRRCLHYFLPHLDLFKGKSPTAMDNVAKICWNLLREIITNPKSLETL